MGAVRVSFPHQMGLPFTFSSGLQTGLAANLLRGPGQVALASLGHYFLICKMEFDGDSLLVS